MDEKNIPQLTDPCINCGIELTGTFCYACGEKKLNPSKDYSIVKFLEHTIDSFSHFDSKFIRSFWALLSKPGLLTAEFIQGKRVAYMKPVQIFIVTSIIFYFIYPTSTTFYQSVADMKNGNILRYDVTQAIQETMVAEGATMEQVVKAVNLEAAQKSKAYLFLIIPFWSIMMYVLFRRSISYLVPHIVFAVHSLSFFVLLFMIYITVFLIFGLSNLNDPLLIPLFVLFFVYMFIGIRKVYGENIFLSTVKSIVLLSVFLGLLVIYRQIITICALNW